MNGHLPKSAPTLLLAYFSYMPDSCKQSLKCFYIHPSLPHKLMQFASEASRDVANLTERKNLHTPEYGVKEFVYFNILSR